MKKTKKDAERDRLAKQMLREIAKQHDTTPADVLFALVAREHHRVFQPAPDLDWATLQPAPVDPFEAALTRVNNAFNTMMGNRR